MLAKTKLVSLINTELVYTILELFTYSYTLSQFQHLPMKLSSLFSFDWYFSYFSFRFYRNNHTFNHFSVIQIVLPNVISHNGNCISQMKNLKYYII